MLEPKIQPKILRDLMDEKGLTRAALAKESGVVTKTISRLMKPPADRGKRPRRDTIQSIAKALETTPEFLCGKVSRDIQPKKNVPEDAYETLGLKTQLNVRVDHATRNAMALVCRRYGVKPHQIVMLAPLLFLCVAEQSLKSAPQPIK